MDVSDVNMNFFMVLTKGSNKTPIILCGSLSSDSAMSALLSQYLLGLWQLHVWLCHSFKLNASDRIYLKLWDLKTGYNFFMWVQKLELPFAFWISHFVEVQKFIGSGGKSNTNSKENIELKTSA